MEKKFLNFFSSFLIIASLVNISITFHLKDEQELPGEEIFGESKLKI